MRIVVIGGTGLIGSKLVEKLRAGGHHVVSASPSSGINSITGEGLADAMSGASAVVDVTNAPSWEDAAVMSFFETSTRNLLAAGAAAGVKHFVALSVVGTEQLLESGYFRAKLAQENLIKASSVPYTIVRATQFFEFVKQIADYSTEGNTANMPAAFIQPMSAEDVATELSKVAMAGPANGTIDIAGPKIFRLEELIRINLSAIHDPRTVISNEKGRYYGIAIKDRELVPAGGALLGATQFEDWLARKPELKHA
jgi:uncharacterized protein YbjT (DUF2867 family)